MVRAPCAEHRGRSDAEVLGALATISGYFALVMLAGLDGSAISFSEALLRAVPDDSMLGSRELAGGSPHAL